MERILIYIVVALVSFTLGAGSLKLVERRRDSKEKQARERQQRVNWNIHKQIENNAITVRVERLKNDAARDRSRHAMLNQRVCELESLIVANADPQLEMAGAANFNIKVGPRKVLYKGKDLLKYINSLENEIKQVKEAIVGNSDKE